MDYGMIRVAAAIPSVRVADPQYNVEHLFPHIAEACQQGASLLLFPELCLTGCSCQDVFRQQLLLSAAENALAYLIDHSRGKAVTIVVGLPVCADNRLYDVAAVVTNGHLDGIVAKKHLFNHNEGGGSRWFASSRDISEQMLTLAGHEVLLTQRPQLFKTINGVRFGIEIDTDVWSGNPPSSRLCGLGADIIVCSAAGNEQVERYRYLKTLLSQQSARTNAAYVYAGCGYGESTQDVVYGGGAMVFENGQLMAEAKRFQLTPQTVMADIDIDLLHHERIWRKEERVAQYKDADTLIVKDCLTPSSAGDLLPSPLTLSFRRPISPTPFIPKEEEMTETCEDVLHIQALGLAHRLQHINCRTAVIGISGGLDSTLALLVTVRTFDMLHYDRKNIIGITMPGFGTSGRTYNNALKLMEALGITVREISIAKAVEQHFADIGHDIANRDTTYENAQARERTQILMDIANDVNGIVIGTGDMSELALGWATYNGDHMSMYGVNAGVPKTLVRHLVKHVGTQQAELQPLLADIVDTPISPELLPEDEATGKGQQTEDLVGPYELHDFFLYYTLRYGFSPRKVFFMACHAFEKAPHAYDEKTIKHWISVFYRRFFSQQFKRSCLPDGPRVGTVCLSPRGAWCMPSDATVALWKQECEGL